MSTVKKAIASVSTDVPLDDWTAFATATKLKKGQLNKIRPFITEKDPEALPIDGEPDPDLRDTEIVPFLYIGGIDAFMKSEVLPYNPDAWVDEKKTTIGYEISFTKYFYKPVQLRRMQEIIDDLSELEKQVGSLTESVMGELV